MYPYKKVEDILCPPVWFNSYFNQDRNLFIKEWYDKSIRNLVGFLDNDGKFYLFNDFRHKYNKNGAFFDFHSVLRTIPNKWKTKTLKNI